MPSIKGGIVLVAKKCKKEKRTKKAKKERKKGTDLFFRRGPK
jgi:hypothetical protein